MSSLPPRGDGADRPWSPEPGAYDHWAAVPALKLAAATLVGRGADMATAQVYDHSSGALLLVGHLGFDADFADFFAVVGKPGGGEATSCAAAVERRAPVVVADVAKHEDFDEQSRQAVLAGGSHACVSVPVWASDGRLAGVLSAHYRNPGSRETTTIVEVAGQARQLLESGTHTPLPAYDEVLNSLQEQVRQLQAALVHRAVIEQAKGIVMGSTGCDPDTAFGVLVAQSQHENRKLREVAAELVSRARKTRDGHDPARESPREPV